VTTENQIQSAFALTDTTLAEQKYADTEYVYKHSVHIGLGEQSFF
jgi:hypothetical protein